MINDGVEIYNNVKGIVITKKAARKFAKLLPQGRMQPLSSTKLIPMINKNEFFDDLFEGEWITREIINDIAKISLINYRIPIGSCKRGRFLMVTEADRSYAIDFLKSGGYSKNSYEENGVRKEGHFHTLRWNAINDVPLLNGKADKPKIKIKRRGGKKKMKKQTTAKPIYEIPENSCVHYDEEMELIVIRPFDDDKKPNPKMIDAYEVSTDTLANHGDVIEAAMHIGQKSWMNKEMLIDFIKLALNKL